jgi:pimeloyl-ACP methyl ester carboxylesterase
VACFLVAAGLVAGCGSAAHPPPPSTGGVSRTVRVDGYALTLKCSGPARTASPTVVLLAGLTEPLTTFASIQERLSSATRVCSYDRPGEGSSQKPRSQQTLADSAKLLHGLLAKLGSARGGFVLVGHSLGGDIAAEYASRYRSRLTKAVILLDATPIGFARAVEKLIPPATQGLAGEVRRVNVAIAAGDNPERLVLGTAPMPAIGAVPLTVVRHGRPIYSAVPRYGHGLESIWEAGQRAWLRLSDRSRMVVARRSGHAIYIDQPALTLALIRQAISHAP